MVNEENIYLDIANVYGMQYRDYIQLLKQTGEDIVFKQIPFCQTYSIKAPEFEDRCENCYPMMWEWKGVQTLTDIINRINRKYYVCSFCHTITCQITHLPNCFICKYGVYKKTNNFPAPTTEDLVLKALDIPPNALTNLRRKHIPKIIRDRTYIRYRTSASPIIPLLIKWDAEEHDHEYMFHFND